MRCGRDGATVQHRKPRGMGGSSNPEINSPANLLWVCGTGTTGCHGWMERNRTEALAAGWLVPSAVKAESIPVQTWDGRFVFLDDDCGYS